jgi:alpha-N-arabinofuranosidase
VNGEGKEAPHLIEEVYNLEDALVVAGFLHSVIRHADCVKIANLAQIVNVIAPILTRGDDLLVQSIFHPFEMFSKRRQGISLKVAVEGAAYEGKTNGRTTFADASAIMDGQRLHVFVTNRSPDQNMELTLNPADINISRADSAEILTGPDAQAANSYEKPDMVRSRAYDAITVKDGRARCELPPLSLLAATFSVR